MNVVKIDSRYGSIKSKTCLLYDKKSYQERLIYKKSWGSRLITVMKAVNIRNRYSLIKSKACLLYEKESYQKRLIYNNHEVEDWKSVTTIMWNSDSRGNHGFGYLIWFSN